MDWSFHRNMPPAREMRELANAKCCETKAYYCVFCLLFFLLFFQALIKSFYVLFSYLMKKVFYVVFSHYYFVSPILPPSPPSKISEQVNLRIKTALPKTLFPDE